MIKDRVLHHRDHLHKAVILCLAIISIGFWAEGLEPGSYEEPPILSARDTLPAELLRSDHFMVKDEVENDGFMNHYTIVSEVGDLEAHSDLEVRIRVNEILAIVELQEVSRTEAFAEAVLESAKHPVRVTKQVVTHPVETVKGVPDGVSRFFKRSWRQVQDGYEIVDDKRQEVVDRDKEATEDGDEEDDTSFAHDVSKVSDQAKEAGTTYTRRKVGVDKKLRQYARELGVDPYSSNAVLQEELERVAKVSAAGGFATHLVMPSVDWLGYVGKVNEVVWELNPLDLRMRNENLLRELGVPQEGIEAFYENRAYTETIRTQIIDDAVRLKEVKGLHHLAEAAWRVGSPGEAIFFMQLFRFLADFHEGSEALISIVERDFVPAAKTSSGRVIFALPVDYLIWSEALAGLAPRTLEQLRAAAPSGPVEMWLLGEASPRTRKELEAVGFVVHSRSFDEVAGKIDRR